MSYIINNKNITNEDFIDQKHNNTQSGGSLETLSVPLGLLILNQVYPDTSKTIYDVQTHNYIEENDSNNNSDVINGVNDSVDEGLYEKLLNMISVSKEKRIKTKTRKKNVKKNRITKKK